MGYYLSDCIYHEEYQDYNLVSLRPLTWLRKLSKLERLVAKEEAIKRVKAAEKSIRQMAFSEPSHQAELRIPKILIHGPPKKYVESAYELDFLTEKNREDWFTLILSQTEEIIIDEIRSPIFGSTYQRVLRNPENPDEENPQFIALNIYPEDGRRGILFYVSKTCKSTIPFDLMRVELTMPFGLEKDFFKLYEQNLNLSLS